MSEKYYIKNKENNKILNKKLEWSKDLFSYNLMAFDTKEEAKLAIPAETNCLVIKAFKNKIKTSCCIKSLIANKCYLDKNDQFTVWSAGMPEVASFASEDEAIAKAESLNLDLDSIKIIMLPTNEEK